METAPLRSGTIEYPPDNEDRGDRRSPSITESAGGPVLRARRHAGGISANKGGQPIVIENFYGYIDDLR
jgi:hypothetical protein